jgi:hypothetical protein
MNRWERMIGYCQKPEVVAKIHHFFDSELSPSKVPRDIGSLSLVAESVLS